MSRQVSSGSAGEYQADEHAGVRILKSSQLLCVCSFSFCSSRNAFWFLSWLWYTEFFLTYGTEALGALILHKWNKLVEMEGRGKKGSAPKPSL